MIQELSKEQIKELFTFVEKKYVRYIDVQYELVDHLATAIEEELTNDTSIGFQTALDKVYSRFPITGFDQFVTSREKAMEKYWHRKQKTILKQYFTLPKLFMTIMLAILFGSLAIINNHFPIWILIALNVVALIYLMIIGFGSNSKQNKKYLVLDRFYKVSSGLAFVPMACLNFQPVWNVDINADLVFFDWRYYAVIVFCTLSTLMFHATMFEFPKIIKEEIANKYAHLKIKTV